DGPRFETFTVSVTLEFGSAVDGPVTVTAMSLLGTIAVVMLAELFVVFGSLVADDTVAVFVAVIAAAVLAASEVRLQGNGVHAPLALTNFRPATAGSVIVTLEAATGPPFVTVTV